MPEDSKEYKILRRHYYDTLPQVCGILFKSKNAYPEDYNLLAAGYKRAEDLLDLYTLKAGKARPCRLAFLRSIRAVPVGAEDKKD